MAPPPAPLGRLCAPRSPEGEHEQSQVALGSMEAPGVAAMTQGGAGRGLVRGSEGRGLAAGGVRVVRTTGCPPVSAAQSGSASPA